MDAEEADTHPHDDPTTSIDAAEEGQEGGQQETHKQRAARQGRTQHAHDSTVGRLIKLHGGTVEPGSREGRVRVLAERIKETALAHQLSAGLLYSPSRGWNRPTQTVGPNLTFP